MTFLIQRAITLMARAMTALVVIMMKVVSMCRHLDLKIQMQARSSMMSKMLSMQTTTTS